MFQQQSAAGGKKRFVYFATKELHYIKDSPMGGHFQWVTKAKWKTLPPSHITQETQYHQIKEIHIEENQKKVFLENRLTQ